jgi:hypothetical protein
MAHDRQPLRAPRPRGPTPSQGAFVSASVFFFAAVILLWVMALLDER